MCIAFTLMCVCVLLILFVLFILSNSLCTVTEQEETGVAPRFSEPLQPVVAEEHKPVSLKCVVEGTPTPTVKWYKGNEEVIPSETKKVTFNPKTGEATLELLEPVKEDEVIYKVKADNKFGRAECRANLILQHAVTVTKPMILYAPEIIKPVRAVVAKPDETIVLDVEYKTATEAEVTWFRNNKKVTPTKDVEIVEEDSKTTLVIKKTAPQKTGKYEVRVKNAGGEAKTSGSVTVSDSPEMADVVAPKFIKPVKPQIVAQGEVVIMEAIVESHPNASFQWFQNTMPIQAAPGVRIVTTENRSILLVNDIDTAFSGLYTCRAENVAGSATCTASVNVLEEEWEEVTEFIAPRFESPLVPTKVMDGERVSLTCRVTGKPIPKVEWLHNGQPIQEAKDVIMSQDSEGVCMLAISEVFPENAGMYTCTAVNKVGEAVCAATLIVDGKYYQHKSFC